MTWNVPARLLSATMAALACGWPLALAADEDAPQQTPPTETSATEEKPAEDWDQLSARKLEIAKGLKALETEFATVALERKKEIQSEFQTLLFEFHSDISPKMANLAPGVFEADPMNFEAGEFVIRGAFDDGRWNDVVAVANQLQQAGHESKAVASRLGAAYFRLDEFQKAADVLSEAQTMNQLDEIGLQYVDDAADYVGFWKQEQELRATESAAEGEDRLPQAEFQTTQGTIKLELFENQAPNTVANFISLIESGHYDGIRFHRVVPDFVIQAGDANSKDDDRSDDGSGSVGYTIKDECFREDARMHFTGSLSMAKTAQPDSGGAQFFVTHRPTSHLNGDAELRTGHTVFGRVLAGMDVVLAISEEDKIEKAAVLFKRAHEYVPEKIVSDTPEKSEDKDKKPGE